MKIAVIGTGYVGLVAGACFAETGNDVICMDVDKTKIALLRKCKVPIYEPGLEEMIRRNVEEERLFFTTDLTRAVQNSSIIFIAVGTPAGEDGSSDVSYVLDAARSIGKVMDGYKIIVNKSTVPVGTSARMRKEIVRVTHFRFDIVSNPEFLKEGEAIEDFMKPDRVVIGTEKVSVAEIMKELYGPFTRTGSPILVMNTVSAEMTKYAANAMLASRVSFMNEIANLCEHVGADEYWVRQGIGTDCRIGTSFLFSGVGYGGSCFPKDIKALISMAREYNYSLKLISAIEAVNDLQKHVIVEKILKYYSSELPAQLEKLKETVSAEKPLSPSGFAQGNRLSKEKRHDECLSVDSSKTRKMVFNDNNRKLHSISLTGSKGLSAHNSPIRGKTFAVWGLSFKPQTDDMREAPSRVIVQRLIELGAHVQVYDPEAMEEARKFFGKKIRYATNDYEALKGADALILVTEWNLFRNPDFGKMKALLRCPVIFDGRNQYNPQELRELGFVYLGIGRG